LCRVHGRWLLEIKGILERESGRSSPAKAHPEAFEQCGKVIASVAKQSRFYEDFDEIPASLRSLQ
ncbi:MAG: hypothetical protein JSW56_11955, partial [Deltaproteobacteria bacterium]